MWHTVACAGVSEFRVACSALRCFVEPRSCDGEVLHVGSGGIAFGMEGFSDATMLEVLQSCHVGTFHPETLPRCSRKRMDPPFVRGKAEGLPRERP